MQRLDCDICLQDIEDYYDTTVDMIDHSQRLLSMAADNPHGAKLLSSGRVVILRDGVSRRRFARHPPPRTGKLTPFPPFHSISNRTSQCCLSRRRLPGGPRRTGFWR